MGVHARLPLPTAAVRPGCSAVTLLSFQRPSPDPCTHASADGQGLPRCGSCESAAVNFQAHVSERVRVLSQARTWWSG